MENDAHEKAGGRRLLWLASFLLLALYGCTLLLPHRNNNLMAGDGQLYYAYMRTLWLDGDIDLLNDAELVNARLPTRHDPAFEMPDDVHHFSIGPALLWSPAFLLAHGAALLLAWSGVAIDPNGYSLFEQAVVGFASVLYGCLTLFLVFALLRRAFPERAARAATLYMALASTFLYYALLEPHMSHVLATFTCALFLVMLQKFDARPKHSTGYRSGAARMRIVALLALAAALMILVRWQNVIFLLLVLPTAWKQARGGPKTAVAIHAGLFLSLLLVGLLPQLLFWRAAYGQWLTLPQGEGFMQWTQPQLLSVLFSMRHGLFSWTPVILLALLGLLIGLRSPARRGTVAGFLVVFTLSVYINAAAGDWWAGAAFGARRFTAFLPIFAFGLAILFAHARTRARRVALHGLCVALVVFNLLFITQYRLETIPHETAITFRQWGIEKLAFPLEAPRAILRKLGTTKTR